jgi:hypothetical protein
MRAFRLLLMWFERSPGVFAGGGGGAATGTNVSELGITVTELGQTVKVIS